MSLSTKASDMEKVARREKLIFIREREYSKINFDFEARIQVTYIDPVMVIDLRPFVHSPFVLESYRPLLGHV